MSELGTMMLRAGLLSDGEVLAVNEHASIRSTSHVEAILELGLADEDTLVAFLASKLMIPRVRRNVLERVDSATVSRIPAALAREHRVLPVSADDAGNVTLAMADPTDVAAVRAVSAHCSAYLVRGVAKASELARGLERAYANLPDPAAPVPLTEGHRPTEPALAAAPAPAPDPALAPEPDAPQSNAPTSPLANQPGPLRSAAPLQTDLTTRRPPVAPYMTPAAGLVEPDAPSPADSIPAGVSSPVVPPDPDEPPDPDATESSLAPTVIADIDDHERPTRVEARVEAQPPSRHTPPMGSAPVERGATPEPSVAPHSPTPPPAGWSPPLRGFNSEISPLSPEAFAQVLPAIEQAQNRDDITALLLDFLGAGFSRVILFVHSHNELKGLDARGKDLLVEAVRQVRIPSTGKSMFSQVIERGMPFFGPLPATNKIDVAFASALGGVKGNVLILPIEVGTKIPLLLWAHGTAQAVDPHSINELTTAVSAAIIRIISSARRG